MLPNPHLSIVIPTFNRSEFLDYCLELNIPLVKEHNIQIFISDNASTDRTAEIVRKRSAEYPLIKYKRNETNVGADLNFERALKYPDTEYVWLLGDTYQIPSEGINYILNLITTANSKKYDAIIFNNRRVHDVPQQNYTDQNKLLFDLGWHMTLMASLVYSSEIIQNGNFKRYRDTNLIQTGVILEYLSNKNILVNWAGSLSVKGIRIEGLIKDSWQDKTFEIWVNCWINLILSLPPSYDLIIKLKCIKDHAHKSKLFKFNKLLRLRAVNDFNYNLYRKYFDVLPLVVSWRKIALMCLIALMPRSVANKSLLRRI